MTQRIVTILACVLFFAVCSGFLSAATAERPNIVFIMADDLGWRDTSPYGSKYYPTPHIDRLSQRGMRFTRAYAANPFCSPTRASIMTGLWPARIGITVPACHVEEVVTEKCGLVERGHPGVRTRNAISLTRLKQEYRTLAEELKDAGYATGHFGKWHLGRDPYNPQNQGFDIDVPHWSGPGPNAYLPPWKFPKAIAEWFIPKHDREHIEDRMADEAIAFMEANKGKPFYLNYWAFSVHSPWQAKPELIDQYEFSRDPASEQRNALYAAMIHSLDDAVGKLIDALDRLHLADKTLIVFTSDNGGIAEKVQQFEDPITSNQPLRAGKGAVYEGGVRVPFIVSWPNHVQAGSVCGEIIQSVDYYPTFLDLLGIKPKEGQPFDGISILPALKGGKLNRDAIYCHIPHTNSPLLDYLAGTAVWEGDWKLIRFYCKSDDLTDTFELYNLKDDISETRDLAKEHPDRVASMKKKMDAFLKDTDAVIPTVNPFYRELPADHPMQQERERVIEKEKREGPSKQGGQ